MGGKLVSVVVRALNEEKWLDRALQACQSQVLDEGTELELILVDSGSTDRTVSIAKNRGCRIVHIRKADFTFGRSLNLGCAAARGDVLVFISAHCIPIDATWLRSMISPLADRTCEYVYGRQVGHETSRYSERHVFAHYFGRVSQVPQRGFFCNNANAAVLADTWRRIRFDESVTGLEDMVFAKAVLSGGGQIGYVAEAAVEHIHEETLKQTHRRYYREALTMRSIMPEVHFNLWDMVSCTTSGVMHDMGEAIRENVFFREAAGIVGFRFNQYWGTYRGHNEHRALSQAQKISYYYPQSSKRKARSAEVLSDAGAQVDARAPWASSTVGADLTRD